MHLPRPGVPYAGAGCSSAGLFTRSCHASENASPNNPSATITRDFVQSPLGCGCAALLVSRAGSAAGVGVGAGRNRSRSSYLREIVAVSGLRPIVKAAWAEDLFNNRSQVAVSSRDVPDNGNSA